MFLQLFVYPLNLHKRVQFDILSGFNTVLDPDEVRA